MTTDNDGNAVVLKALKGYFDKLAAAATNEKTVLEQLVASNANFAATNEELVDVVKKLTNNNKDIQIESNRLKKCGGSRATQGKKYPTMCPIFKEGGLS